MNSQKDENGLTYARKAMILCGIPLDTTGKWEISQLKPELQEIIKAQKIYFDNHGLE